MVAQLCAATGVVAGFWHIRWIAGVAVLASGLACDRRPLTCSDAASPRSRPQQIAEACADAAEIANAPQDCAQAIIQALKGSDLCGKVGFCLEVFDVSNVRAELQRVRRDCRGPAGDVAV